MPNIRNMGQKKKMHIYHEPINIHSLKGIQHPRQGLGREEKKIKAKPS